MKVEEFVVLLKEYYDNDIPISFKSLLNTVKEVDEFYMYIADEINYNRTMHNNFNLINKDLHYIKRYYLKDKYERTLFNLWIGFIDEYNVIICQLYNKRYASTLYLNDINREGSQLYTKYNTIDKDLELLPEEYKNWKRICKY